MNNKEVIERKYKEAVKGLKEEWFWDLSTKWYNYIINLPDDLQFTYLILVMHNQVLNGGFHQYFVNGYGQFAKETINALLKIEAFTKAELLRKALILVNSESLKDDVFREKLLNKQIEDLFINENLFDPLDELDAIYYKNENEDLEYLLGKFLNK